MKEKDEYMLNERTFCVFLTSVGIITFLGGVLGLIQAKGSITVAAYFFGCSAAFFCRFLVKKSICYKKILIFFMAITQGGLLPFLFICEGGIYGPIPIWMALNLIFIFMLFEGRVLSVFCAGILLEYGYLLAKYSSLDRNSAYLINKGRIFIDFTFVLLSAISWLLLVIFVQEKRYRDEEQKRRDSEASVKESAKTKNRFLGAFAVALRKPMTLIVGMTELILKEIRDNFIHSEVTHMKAASYDVLSILNDTYNYSELSAGMKKVHEENYLFDELLGSIAKLAAEEMKSANIRFIMEVSPDIPKVLCGDSRYIRKVFFQLLTASVMMTTEGRIHLEIAANRSDRLDEVTLQCSLFHTGRGLSAEEIETLFGHYEQYPLTERGNLEGVALKFSVCREYLRVMGGTIEVDSLLHVGMAIKFSFQNKIVEAEPICMVDQNRASTVLIYMEDETDKTSWHKIMEGLALKPDYADNRYRFEHAIRDKKYGCIFISKKLYESLSAIIAYYHCEKETYIVGGPEDAYGDFGECRIIRQPLYCTKAAEVLNGKWRAEDYQYPADEGNFLVKGGRILVIDDNPVDLKVATSLFAKYGVDIDIAVNGEDGLKKIETEAYHLVITDLFMEQMDGIEVMNRIRKLEDKECAQIPVAVITSDIRENIKEEQLSYGFAYFLSKPIQMKAIEECMLQVLPDRLICSNGRRSKKGDRKEVFGKEERGLDIRKGLANIGYREDAYAAILNTYYSENTKKQKDLLTVYKKEELPVFISAVHGIKSASASIGAMGLSFLARELEYAGKDENLGLIGERLPLFLKEYQLILEEIRAYLINMGQFATEKEGAKNENRIAEALRKDRLELLKAPLGRMDLKACGRLLEEMQEANFGTEDNEEVGRMKEAFDKFDFHAVKTVLNRLLEKKIDD